MVDGDHSLVLANETFIKVAERNMTNIVPLYYDAKKAKPSELTNKTIYDGIVQAFNHSNIGEFSNLLTNAWEDMSIWKYGTQDQKDELMKFIKIVCMLNNYRIDEAKTQYFPELNEWYLEYRKKYKNNKMPYFFKYAKNYSDKQIRDIGEGVIDRLYAKIPNPAIRMNSKKLKAMGIGNFDYKLLMNNKNITITEEHTPLIERYTEFAKKYRHKLNQDENITLNGEYLNFQLRTSLMEFGYTEQEIADILVEYLYGTKNKRQNLLWFCYGEILYDNLKNNLDKQNDNVKQVQCMDCGKWFEVPIKNNRTKRCDSCQRIENNKNKLIYWHNNKN